MNRLLPAPMAQPAASSEAVGFRRGIAGDIAALLVLEAAVFTTDRIGRRGFRRFLGSPTAVLLVAETARPGSRGSLAGYALVLFRTGSTLARLYSVAVAPPHTGRGIGPALIAGMEAQARSRGCTRMRLEVQEGNARAIARYRAAGYSQFGRYEDYYKDHTSALRFEKKLLEPDRSVTISAHGNGTAVLD